MIRKQDLGMVGQAVDFDGGLQRWGQFLGNRETGSAVVSGGCKWLLDFEEPTCFHPGKTESDFHSGVLGVFHFKLKKRKEKEAENWKIEQAGSKAGRNGSAKYT